MKWIGKGTLRISKEKTLFYGDDIPKGFPKDRLKTLQKQGKIGDIIEKISEHPEVRALNEKIRRKDQKIEALEAELAELKKDEPAIPEPPAGDDK